MNQPNFVTPPRQGSKPNTTPTNPHMQLTQQPVSDEPRRMLRQELSRLGQVDWKPSMISVPGAEALTLQSEDALGPRNAFMVGGEFAHLHPAPDYSLHLVLPPDVARAAIEAGWAERHPIAARGLIPFETVMVYAPRGSAEVEVVAQLVNTSFLYASGVQE